MRLTFSAKYKVGDKVQVLPGEHDFNWQGKIGKIVDVGIDLSWSSRTRCLSRAFSRRI